MYIPLIKRIKPFQHFPMTSEFPPRVSFIFSQHFTVKTASPGHMKCHAALPDHGSCDSLGPATPEPKKNTPGTPGDGLIYNILYPVNIPIYPVGFNIVDINWYTMFNTQLLNWMLMGILPSISRLLWGSTCGEVIDKWRLLFYEIVGLSIYAPVLLGIIFIDPI